MIKLIEKVLHEKIPEITGNQPLSFIKYSTPTSGKHPDDKVVFFVFKKGTSVPIVCIKTVRSYEGRESIVRNFKHLKALNAHIAGTKHEKLFARTLTLYDDGEQVFSAETMCSGSRKRISERELRSVVRAYIDFQAFLAVTARETIEDIGAYAREKLESAEMSDTDREDVLAFLQTLQAKGLKMPRLFQHGDFTEDNVLLSAEGPSFVDHDFFGTVDLPGFDLFGLFLRHGSREAETLCRQYFPEYFSHIGAAVTTAHYPSLLFVYFVLGRTLRKRNLAKSASGNELIAEFKNVFPFTKERVE